MDSQELQSPAIKTIKTALPYLNEKYRRNLGIMIKLIEIDALMKIRPSQKNNDDMEGMIKAVMLQAYGKEQTERFLKILSVMKIMREGKNGAE